MFNGESRSEGAGRPALSVRSAYGVSDPQTRGAPPRFYCPPAHARQPGPSWFGGRSTTNLTVLLASRRREHPHPSFIEVSSEAPFGRVDGEVAGAGEDGPTILQNQDLVILSKARSRLTNSRHRTRQPRDDLERPTLREYSLHTQPSESAYLARTTNNVDVRFP
jgi:hypothetical protein